MPSILSRTPPWPGNISLVFLTFAILFNKEINKSPAWDVNEIKIVIIINEGSSYKCKYFIKKGTHNKEK